MKRYLSAVARWFDNDAPSAGVDPDSVEAVRVLPFALLHLACLGVLWVGWSPAALLACAVAYVARMFAVTGIYHRYFSHRTYSVSRPVQFLFALFGATAVQRGPLWWAAHHRHHHRHSDGPEDPHSPNQKGLLWSHMLWLTTARNFPTRTKLVGDLVKYPELRFLDRFDMLVPVVFATFIFWLGGRLADLGVATSSWQMLVWGFFISTVLLFHGTCTINSLAHRMGRKRYDTGDHSRNSFLLALVTLGEGWHNNHHHYPGSVRQGFYWWEIDVTYYILRLFAALGLVRDLNPVPVRVYEKANIRP